MAIDTINTEDNAETNILESSQPARQKYTVTSEAGLFKNGKHYKEGDTVELDAKTAQNFIDLGEVE